MTDLWKRSAESRLFDFDFSQGNLMPSGVALASANVAQANLNRMLGSGDLDLNGGAAAVSGQLAQLEIGGGTDGEVYQLIATGLDGSGRAYPLFGFMNVSDSDIGSTLVVGTDAYIDLAWADSYFADRTKAAWETANPLKKEAAIRQGTQFIDATYAFVGCVASLTQVLKWPRSSAYNREGQLLAGIPLVVQQATAELALEALSASLLPSQDRGGAVKREKVDVLEVEYFEGAPGRKTYPLVNRLLEGVIKPKGLLRA